MQFGVTMFPTDYAIQPHELAVEAEARGFSVYYLANAVLTSLPTSSSSASRATSPSRRQTSRSHASISAPSVESTGCGSDFSLT